MIRRMVRLLETVSAVAPHISRARPLVHGVCRVLGPVMAWGRGAPGRLRGAYGRLRRIGARLRRMGLGPEGRRQIILEARALAARLILHLWARADRFRPLLNENPAELNVTQRAQYRILSAFLALPDRHYRQALARFIWTWAGPLGEDIRSRLADPQYQIGEVIS